MSKSGGSVSLKWTGTKGDDTVTPTNLDTFLHTTYNGGAGYDTLDLHLLSSGVSLDVVVGPGGGSSHVWNAALTGSWWDFNDRTLVNTTRVDGSITNFEKLIGTSFNDYLELRGGTFDRVVDGGAGDDSIYVSGTSGTSTSIGGAGSDQLFGEGSNAVLVGGSYTNHTIAPDDTRDEFFMDAGTILDFNPAVDSLYFDTGTLNSSVATASWTDVHTAYGDGAQLQVSATQSVTIIGETAAEMNQIPKGFLLDGSGNVTSGPGDDFIYDGGTTAASTYTLPSGSGHDELLGFDLAADTLIFPNETSVSWSEVSYHGETSLLTTYDDGHSSLLLIGLTSADIPSLHIDY